MLLPEIQRYVSGDRVVTPYCEWDLGVDSPEEINSAYQRFKAESEGHLAAGRYREYVFSFDLPYQEAAFEEVSDLLSEADTREIREYHAEALNF